MKLLLLLTLSIFAFAINPSNVTDIQDLRTNADEILFMQSSSFECNLYIEKAGQYLLLMNKAEQSSNLSALSNNYILFLDNSNRAIAICKEINQTVTNDLIDVQSNIEIYYDVEKQLGLTDNQTKKTSKFGIIEGEIERKKMNK